MTAKLDYDLIIKLMVVRLDCKLLTLRRLPSAIERRRGCGHGRRQPPRATGTAGGKAPSFEKPQHHVVRVFHWASTGSILR